jgi:outer membrane receptor protein involved in Fe transport
MRGIAVVAVVLAALGPIVPAQSNAGAIRGGVSDPTGAAISNAKVRLRNLLTNYEQTVTTDDRGLYQLIDIPFNRYRLTVEAGGFEEITREVIVRSSLQQQIDFIMSITPAAEEVSIFAAGSLLEPEKTGASVVIDRNRIMHFAAAQPSRSTEAIVATTPGWTLNANGRLHARGNEYQVQYSIDGIPVTDTIAATFAAAPDPRNFRSVEVMTSNLPAEYGSKLSGVIAVNSRSGLEGPRAGSITLSGGSFSTLETSFDFGGRAGNVGYFVSAAGSTTNRFLDPPAVENLHNRGRALMSFIKLDYGPNQKDLVRLNLFTNGAGLEIPNLPEQQLAGQDQRRKLRDNMQSLSWQRVISDRAVSLLSLYHRYTSSRLESNELSSPALAEQSRRHSNYGALGSLTFQQDRNTIKAGFEVTRFPVSESFTFAITDLEELLERVPDLTREARQFTRSRPFLFNERRAGWQGGLYVQDQLKATGRLTLSLGARLDSYHFLSSGTHISPRVGAAYFIESTGTVLRASVDRLVETPALENLLLSSSEKTRLFSPEEDDASQSVRGLPVPLGRAWQYDVGFQQQLSRYVRLDADFYYRRSRNNAEIINFIETEVAFPATLARSRSKGIEARLDLAQVRGFSGYASYTNLNIYGIAPITGGLFLGEAAELRDQAGRRIKNEEDQRNTIVFEARYEYEPARIWIAFGGRHDSGFAVELDEDSSIEDFEGRFPRRILGEVNLARGFIKPHTVLQLSAGKSFRLNERARVVGQFNLHNLSDRFYLITFGSLFTGTNIGRPRSYSASLGIRYN